MKNKPDKHKLTTLYTNIDNSLLSKIDELKLRISLENPDIICLSEIKPKNGLIPSKEVNNNKNILFHMERILQTL